MHSSLPPIRLRIGAIVLLASLVSLAVQAPSPSGTGAEVRPAAWLKAQVRKADDAAATQEGANPKEAFDRALAEAQAADARTLHSFLATFLDAHARLTGTEAVPTAGRSCQALIQELREQLARAGLVVRPPTQMSAPPAAPQQLARWMVASLLVPLSERFAASEDGARPPAWERPALMSHFQQVVAPVAQGGLIRVLFTGRPLGP